MDPSSFRKIREIVLEASKLPVGQRAAFLDEACGSDAELRAEVESLLGSTDAPDILKPGQVAEEVARQLSQDEPEVDDRLGPYRLLEMIGEGGMGVVYHARQEEPLQRDVALKLIGWSLVSESMRARFEAEREALSRMDHPNIARVLDAGEDERGRPYVVMELVRGEPITTYCDSKQLSIQERVALFVRVCLAVHHAHQKGVLHRDLKPSNIMVEEIDDEPVPKLIDFGIAKSLKSPEGLTRVGQLVGTPEYMSPEQAGESDAGTDTRSDIYSLGIVLHELLVGDLPVGRETLRGKAPTEVQRLLRDHDPRKPSTRLKSTPAADQERLVASRATTLGRLTKEIAGDLDWVTLKAVARDPTQRYSSASEFAADLRRYLQHHPVEAGPPTRTAQLRKFVRRHRAPVVLATVVTTLLIAGVVSTTWQWRRAQAQANLAQLRLGAVNDFAIRFMNDVDREVVKLPNSTPTRQAIAQLALTHLDRLSESSGDARGIELALSRGYDRVSSMHATLGDMDQALEFNQKALEYTQLEVERNPGSPTGWNTLGQREARRAGYLRRSGHTEEALHFYQRAIDTFRGIVERHPDYRFARNNLALHLGNAGWLNYTMSKLPEASELLSQSVEAMTRVRDGDPDDHRGWGHLGNLHGRLGITQTHLGRMEEAEANLRLSIAILEESLERFPSRQAQANSELLISYGRLAQMLMAAERPDEALAASAKAIAVSRGLVETYPNRMRERANLASALGDRASMLLGAGDVATARATYLEGLEAIGPFRGDPEVAESIRQVEARMHRGVARAALEEEDLVVMNNHLTQAYNLDRNLYRDDPASYVYASSLLRTFLLFGEYYQRIGERDANWESIVSASGWYERAENQIAKMTADGMSRPTMAELEAELTLAIARNDSVEQALAP